VTNSSRQLAGVLSGRKRKRYRLSIDGEECDIPQAALRMLKDLKAYKKQQDQESDAAMLELAREAQELGLGYDL